VGRPREAEIAEPETLAQEVRRRFAGIGYTIEGLPDDASEEHVLWFLEALLAKLDEEKAARPGSLSAGTGGAVQDWNPSPMWPLVWRKDAERLELDSFQHGRNHERHERAAHGLGSVSG
jgi:hypothetical protein